MTITKEEQNKMRNCAVFLGEPAATELVRVLDALEAADSASRILADIAVKFAWIMYPCDRCPAGGVTCDSPERGCTGCQYRNEEAEECTAPEDYDCKFHCAPNLLKYAQQKAEAGK